MNIYSAPRLRIAVEGTVPGHSKRVVFIDAALFCSQTLRLPTITAIHMTRGHEYRQELCPLRRRRVHNRLHAKRVLRSASVGFTSDKADRRFSRDESAACLPPLRALPLPFQAGFCIFSGIAPAISPYGPESALNSACDMETLIQAFQSSSVCDVISLSIARIGSGCKVGYHCF